MATVTTTEIRDTWGMRADVVDSDYGPFVELVVSNPDGAFETSLEFTDSSANRLAAALTAATGVQDVSGATDFESITQRLGVALADAAKDGDVDSVAAIVQLGILAAVDPKTEKVLAYIVGAK